MLQEDAQTHREYRNTLKNHCVPLSRGRDAILLKHGSPAITLKPGVGTERPDAQTGGGSGPGSIEESFLNIFVNVFPVNMFESLSNKYKLVKQPEDSAKYYDIELS